MNIQSSPKPSENVWLWLLKIFSGALVLVLLIIHFLVNHFLAPEGLLSHAEVVQYYQNPIIPIMEGLFLLFVLTHSLTGMRGIIMDLNPKQSAMKWVDILFVALGLFAFLYGVYVLAAVVGYGKTV